MNDSEKLKQLRETWADAYRSFRGAFDTPVSRFKINNEYANDARDRLREFDDIINS